MIQLQGIWKTYSVNGAKQDVLKNINLDIEEQQKVFFTGASGVGKTTLFRLICCFDKPSQGSVRIANVDMNRLSSARLASFRQQIAYVPQSPMLLDDLSVLDNVLLAFQSIRETSYEQAYKYAQSALEQVNMDRYARVVPYSLSLGQQQLVALARAIAKRPKIVVADEPTGNLDPELSEQVIRLLQNINEQSKTTLLIATHEERLVRKMAQQDNFQHYQLIAGGVHLQQY